MTGSSGEAAERAGRAAYEYGYTKARMLRDLGYEPRLTNELRWLLHDAFVERHSEGYGGSLDHDTVVDAYWSNFADGFLDEGAAIEGPYDPRERSRALYLLTAVAPDRTDNLGAELRALMAGPHADWAELEGDELAHGRKVGDPPTELRSAHRADEGRP